MLLVRCPLFFLFVHLPRFHVKLACGSQEVAVPDVLYEEVIEVDERVVLKQEDCELPGKLPKHLVTGVKHLSF